MADGFLDLIEPADLPRVVAAIESAVATSFSADGARATQAEVHRRFHLCSRLIRQLRGDLRWGLSRVLDHLPQYLRAELDGQPWEPDPRRCWMPGDGN